MGAQCLDHDRKWISEDPRQISFARNRDWKRQLFHRRDELRSRVGPVFARVDATPAVHGQIHSVQAMQ
jgi:hypothetical protein